MIERIVRAERLMEIGRFAQAERGMRQALAADPESAVTHANRGWSHLDEGRPREALECFKEALRLDAELEWAREGVATALKARWAPYRWFFAFSSWTSRLSEKNRWLLILGLYATFRLSRLHAAGAIFAIFYVGFVLFTWLADPVANLLLRLHPLGRWALSKDDLAASNLVGAAFLAAAACGDLALIPGRGLVATAAPAFVLLALPVSIAYHQPAGRDRRRLLGFAAVLATLALSSAALAALGPGTRGAGVTCAILAMAGCALSTWAFRLLRSRRG